MSLHEDKFFCNKITQGLIRKFKDNVLTLLHFLNALFNYLNFLSTHDYFVLTKIAIYISEHNLVTLIFSCPRIYLHFGETQVFKNLICAFWLIMLSLFRQFPSYRYQVDCQKAIPRTPPTPHPPNLYARYAGPCGQILDSRLPNLQKHPPC